MNLERLKSTLKSVPASGRERLRSCSEKWRQSCMAQGWGEGTGGSSGGGQQGQGGGRGWQHGGEHYAAAAGHAAAWIGSRPPPPACLPPHSTGPHHAALCAALHCTAPPHTVLLPAPAPHTVPPGFPRTYRRVEHVLHLGHHVLKAHTLLAQALHAVQLRGGAGRAGRQRTWKMMRVTRGAAARSGAWSSSISCPRQHNISRRRVRPLPPNNPPHPHYPPPPFTPPPPPTPPTCSS